MKVVIIGGVAGGATAAARIRRLDEQAEIIVFERSGYVSYANCGLPYYIGGVIGDPEELTLQTPESFWERFRIKVKTRHEVTSIHPETKKYTVKIRNKADVEKTFQIFISDDEEMIKYDECSNRLTDRKYVKYSVNDDVASYLEEKDIPVIEGVIKPNEELSYDLHVFVGDAYNLNKKVHYHR